MAKIKTKVSNVDLYEALLSTIPEIERKGATMPYTSLNGNMYSFLSKEGLVGIRLGEHDREAFLEKYKSKLFETYGTVMKEYVTVPPALLKKTKELSKYMKLSFEYAQGLKPKPTTRAKKVVKKKVAVKEKITPKKKK